MTDRIEANQRFWQGIAKRSDAMQEEFWHAAEDLAKHLGDNGKSFEHLYQYNLTPPPDNMPLWEKLFYYLGQSSYNQGVTNYHAGKAAIQGSGWLWGVLKGDFNKDPTMSQVIVGGIISLIPVVDQVCDVRDLIANIYGLSDAEQRKDLSAWFALAITAIGFIPELGSAFKTIIKASWVKKVSKLDLVKAMEPFETLLGKHSPWGRAPEPWLKSKPWTKIGTQAAKTIKEYMNRMISFLKEAQKWASGKVVNEIRRLQNAITEILKKIDKHIQDFCGALERKIQEIISPPRLATAGPGTGVYQAPHRGETSNTHKQKETPPPPRKVMKKHKPKCFKPGDALKAGAKKRGMTPQQLETEFKRQLKGQEDGLNKMSIDEFLTNLDNFDPKKSRGLSASAQEKTRKDALEKLRLDKANELKELGGMTPSQIDKASKKHANDVMSTMAALHNPDMSAGGGIVTTDTGDKGVNSSLGSQWSKEGRVSEMRKEAEAAKKAAGGNAKMNVQLDRCP